MGVDVVWKDVVDVELERAEDNAGWFAQAVGHAQDARRLDLPVLVSIDLYGDTRILPPRTDSLAAELVSVRARTLHPEARIQLGRVITLASAASAKPGTYLLCIGD